MALCPHCQNPLPPDWPATQCASCGGALAASGEPPPIPMPDEPAGPPALPERTGQERAGTEGTGPERAGVDDHARDTGGFTHSPGPPRATPRVWDDRSRIGLATAFVETTRQVLAAPTAFFRAMPVTGGLGSPLLYAVIAGWIGLAAAAFYQAIWVSIVGPARLPFGLDSGELAFVLAWLESWAGLVAQVVFGGVSVVITVFVGSGILHLMLLLLGGARRGFEATFRVVCFSQATTLLMLIPLFLIPFCGLAVVAWCLTLYVIGLAQAHQIGYGQALAAVLLPILALCCCCVGLAVTFAGAIASLAGQMP